jgi:hypothetical protein
MNGPGSGGKVANWLAAIERFRLPSGGVPARRWWTPAWEWITGPDGHV